MKKKILLSFLILFACAFGVLLILGQGSKEITLEDIRREDRENFVAKLSDYGNNFILERDSLLRIYKDAVKAEDYQTALMTLREADSAFYRYMQSVSVVSIKEYIKPFGLFKVLNYGDIDSVDAYVYDKNDGFARMLFSIQREYVERRNEAALR